MVVEYKFSYGPGKLREQIQHVAMVDINGMYLGR